MWSPSPRRRLAVASKLLAVLLGMLLGLSLFSAGSGLEGGVAGGATGGESQAHNQDVPEQPPLRLLDTELHKQDGDDDDRAHGPVFGELSSGPLEPCGGQSRWASFAEACKAGQRVREGHGARGPPRA